VAAFDYVSLRDAVVKPLIKDFGKTATLLAPGPSTGLAYDPQPGTDVSQAIIVTETKVEEKDTVGTNVQMTDTAYLASPEGVTVDPHLADRIVVGGVTYQVIKIVPLRPGPTTMLWKIFARK
jgi:hypothetical protein